MTQNYFNIRPNVIQTKDNRFAVWNDYLKTQIFDIVQKPSYMANIFYQTVYDMNLVASNETILWNCEFFLDEFVIVTKRDVSTFLYALS